MESKDTWRIATFVLLGLLIIETLFLCWAWSSGTEMIEKETECAVDICQGEQYTAYYYDEYDDVCYCFEGDEVTHQKYMG